MNKNSYGRAALFGALGYSGGLALGVLLLALVFSLRIIRFLSRIAPDDQFFIQLLIGLLLGLTFIGAAGGTGGALGGWALMRTESIASPRRFIRRQALSLGLAQAILVLPLLFFAALVAFYSHPADQRSGTVITLFTIYGSLYGLIAGFLLAILTSRLRHAWRVLLGGWLGFTLGGSLVGQMIHWHQADGFLNGLNNLLFLMLLMGVLGLAGGAFLGLAYHWLAVHEATRGEREQPRPRWWQNVRLAALILLIIILSVAAYNLLNLIRIRDAGLQSVIEVGAEGTHWSDPQLVSDGSGDAIQPVVFASGTGQPYVLWSEAVGNWRDIFYTGPAAAPINLSQSEANSIAPAGVVDSAEISHLVWQEGDGATAVILYSRCQEDACSQPVPLTSSAFETCGGGVFTQPAIAIDRQDQVMLVMRRGIDALVYQTWPASAGPENGAAGCVPTGPVTSVQTPALTATGDGRFWLSFADTAVSGIYTAEWVDGRWGAMAQVGQGQSPALFAAADGPVLAWCSPENALTLLDANGSQDTITFPSCHGRPALAQDGFGALHLVWYSPDVVNSFGLVSQDRMLIYGSVRGPDGWTNPAIVARTGQPTEPSLTAVPDGKLYLAWTDETAVQVATQSAYDCADPDLNAIELAVYEALNQPQFKPVNEQLPVCGNQYEAIFYTPNPIPNTSDAQPTLNGAFDQMANQVKTAEYELLFGTMQWDDTSITPSPGSVFATAVADLYQQVQAHPERYPRGMTIRILTGNMPEVALFAVEDHTWHVLRDLQAAGLPELVNEELGWRVEIADFDGAWPHMHTKIMIVDGKTMMAAGYNYSYLHLSQEHPSGLGLSMVDFGIHVTGPVAQATRAAFDDLWDGSDTLECPDPLSQVNTERRSACRRGTAVVSHVPEALQYYLPDGADSDAYALYRTEKHLAGDAGIEAAIRAAEEKIDIFEVNFSLELICDAAIVFQGICSYNNNALPYMVALMETIEAKQIPVRILVEKEAMNGMENKVAINAFVEELDARGLRHLVEIRFYEGKMHSKAVNIDDQFLIIGSQNFHYSAWGENGLTEFSLGTDSRQALADFQDAFEYRWANGIPAEEIMPQLAP